VLTSTLVDRGSFGALLHAITNRGARLRRVVCMLCVM
jgi:hypothetical protein